jgi:hypothetical protein
MRGRIKKLKREGQRGRGSENKKMGMEEGEGVRDRIKIK